MTRIRISLGDLTVHAQLNDTATARTVAQALPLASDANVWGDEVYFTTPLALPEEDSRAEVPDGTVAYWPPGRALCLFFGQTPASPVNVIGHLQEDAAVLQAVNQGDTIVVEAA